MSVYANMKESGIDWIGAVPSHWAMHTLYQLVSSVKVKNKDLSEKNLLSLSYGKIKRKNIEDTEGLLPESFDGYNIIEAGDVVLRLTDLQNDHTSLRVGLATERGIITSAYTTLRPSENCVSKYLYYLLHSFDIRKGFYGMGSGVRQGLNYDEVKELRIVLPRYDEQEAIVAYLDEQCALIDESIAEAQASIEGYKTWKSSVIYQAVTKGIDENVGMKDSGIDWIGLIPKTSDVIRLRYLVSSYKAGPFGSSLITDKLLPNGNILVYTPEHVANNSVESEKNLYLPEERKEEMEQFIVHEGDIIFPIVGSLGRAMRIEKSMPEGIINQRLAKMRINEKILDAEYFMWVFAKGDYLTPYIEINCRGSFIVNLTKTIVYDMPFVLPREIATQRRIAEYLRVTCNNVDEMISEKQRLISDLETYKRSLIYEAVTGKRKVVQ